MSDNINTKIRPTCRTLHRASADVTSLRGPRGSCACWPDRVCRRRLAWDLTDPWLWWTRLLLDHDNGLDCGLGGVDVGVYLGRKGQDELSLLLVLGGGTSASLTLVASCQPVRFLVLFARCIGVMSFFSLRGSLALRMGEGRLPHHRLGLGWLHHRELSRSGGRGSGMCAISGRARGEQEGDARRHCPCNHICSANMRWNLVGTRR
jgi:hypothetical protein